MNHAELIERLRDATRFQGDPIERAELLSVAANALADVVAERDALRSEIEFLRSRRGDLCIERDRARDAIRTALDAINPLDRSGISMEVWNERLKAATAIMQGAMAYDNRKARAALAQEPR